MQGYKTIYEAAEDEFTEKKSRFIGYIAPAASEEDALSVISARKTLHRDATHNVYAYTLRGGIARCTDDGEPQGTAGVPALEALQKAGVTDVCVVVTRYFGGTLLGTGGLIRAYSQAAAQTLKAAKQRLMLPCTVLELSVNYSLYGKAARLLPQYEALVLQSDFGEEVSLRVMLKSENVPVFTDALREATAANAKLSFCEETLSDM
ncbi:MAG: YigZ family protein [Hydrogenoanaerobacterium sp.]